MQQEGGGPALRPLGVGEILDVAIKVYTRNLGTFIGITAIVYVPFSIIVALGFLSVLPEGSFVRNGQLYLGFASDYSAYDAFSIATVIAGFVFSFLVTAIGARAVADAYLLGTKPTIKGSYAAIGRRLPSLLWLILLVGLALSIVVVPGFLVPAAFLVLAPIAVYLSTIWTVSFPAFVIEDVRGTKALGRSRMLVSGRWWVTFGTVLLGVILIPFIIQFAIGFVIALGMQTTDSTSAATWVVLTQAGGLIGQLIATPVQIAVITILYFDLRVRKEAFDIQLLTERIDSLPGDTPTASSPSSQPPSSPSAPPTTSP